MIRVEFYLENQIPKYRNKTLFKDVLENNPDLIDKTMPFQELDEFSEYADYLCDCLKDHYYFSEIAFYYAYEFEHYFKVEMKKNLPKYCTLLKAEIDANINILDREDKTSTINETNSLQHGKKVDETFTENKSESLKYGKTTSTVTENNTTNNETENGSNEKDSTQYERQLVHDASTNTNTVENTSAQNGTYDVTYGGEDNTTNDNSGNKNITNSGTDTETNEKTLSEKNTVRDISAIVSSAGAENIVDEFIGKFHSLFMEVLNV